LTVSDFFRFLGLVGCPGLQKLRRLVILMNIVF
jgi:hypothetical protein